MITALRSTLVFPLRYARYLAVLLCLLAAIPVKAQQQAVLSGLVVLEDQEPAIGAQVSVAHGARTVTDANGAFSMEQLTAGNYELIVDYTGYKEEVVKVTMPYEGKLKIALKRDNRALGNVTVYGLSDNEQVNRQAYNVASIDASKLYNTTLDLAHALDRVSGIRVRESGGVGSSMNFSLNGFSGRQVKMFIDGVPMDNFGSSFQLNNIPVNLAERVEVYKGVVPVWLGADALGGAVNIVTGNKLRNYIDVSYSYGSFNTHRTSINAAITSKKGLTAQISAYQNYSDNNYKVTLDVADINTGAYTRDVTVRRFHDQYRNETIIANVGLVDQRWADKLLFGITLGQNYKEIQTGARMVSVFGTWHTRGNIIMPTLKYQKHDLFVKGLDLSVNANYNFGKEQSIDTAFRRYDWYGNYKQYPGAGGERSRTLYKYGNNMGLATTTLTYALGKRHAVALNNVITSFDRKGYDELQPNSEKFAQPQTTIKNVTGASYRYDIANKWSATVFGKLLYQNAHTRIAQSTPGLNDVKYVDQYNKATNTGYGIATTYYFTPRLQAKLSYEKTNRLPENYELFGDNINQESNFSLRPEQSNNVNLGLTYRLKLADAHQLQVEATGIYRHAHDFIYFRLNNNQSMTVADNLEGVRNMGGELDVQYAYKERLRIEVNGTYQDIRNMVKYEPGYTTVSAVYKDRIPNLPFLFGHGGASYFFSDLLQKGDRLSIGYNALYVHAFYLYWPSRGSRTDKYDVPAQLSHDISLTYTLRNGRYNIAFECKNLTDARLYDNFSLQKPGRAFNVKLRYFYHKQ